jgi:hypothetical protein
MEKALTIVSLVTLLRSTWFNNPVAEHIPDARFNGEAKIKMDSTKVLGTCYLLFGAVAFNIFVCVM